MAPLAKAVEVSLEELRQGTVSFETLQEAFGPDSLGILVVRDVPEEFAELRLRALSYSSYLGNLPKEQLDQLENPAAKYLTGWSLGKETLKSGQVDTLKGSFYANCAFYVSPSLACAEPTADFSAANFPEYLSANVWPTETVLPGFRAAVEALCAVIIDVAVLVARACDRFAEHEIEGYPRGGYLERVVATSTTTKARLLHYFPEEEEEEEAEGEGRGGPMQGEAPPADADADEDDWCATHLDHGCLTGLTSAMFIDEAASVPTIAAAAAAAVAAAPSSSSSSTAPLPPLTELPSCPDPAAGLYIKSRTGDTVQVRIPRGCVAFQTGEALQRITAGRFRAVPHFVRGARRANFVGREEGDGEGKGVAAAAGQRRIARNTLAVFTQPNLGEEVDLDQHITFGEFARGIVAKNTVK